MPAGGFREFGAKLEDPVQTRVAKRNEHVNVAPGRVGPSRNRTEQKHKADVVIGAQRSPEGRDQRPRPPDVLTLGQRDLERSRGRPHRTKTALRYRAPEGSLVYPQLISQER